MRKLYGLAVVILVVMASLSAPSHALTPKQHSEIARLALEKHIRPGYALLASVTSELEETMQFFCAKPSTIGRADVDRQFEKTLMAWSKIEHIRFGPVSMEDRINRFIFWPDHKSIGLRQVKKALRTQKNDVLDQAKLRQKSVALQGLTALEYLLFGTDGEKIGESSSEARFRCAYAMAISKNLALISTGIVEDWRDGKEFVEIYLHPRQDSDIYQTPKEVTLALFLSFTTELKIIQLLKLGRPVGKTEKKARPRRAAFWRSKLEYKVVDANMAGVLALFDRVFSEAVSESDPGVEESVLLDFEQNHRDLLAIKLPIGEAVYDGSERAKLKNLLITIEQIKNDAGTAIIKSADLSMGFNALDGD